MSWDDFKQRLLLRFCPSQNGTLHEQFLAIRQEGTLAENRRTFELLSAPLHGLSMEVLESTFVKGLRLKVKADLRLMRPHRLAQMMELAQLIEDRNMIVKGTKDPDGPRIGRFNSAQGRKTH